MIIVLGSIVAKPETLDSLLRLSHEHVSRSRAEPGCISHDVHLHSENSLKLVFIEKWQDAAALAAHFKVKESIDFVAKARALSAEAPVIEVFEASPLRVG